jgi:two-component system nitrogen regulation sensor histidine kinase NtrY
MDFKRFLLLIATRTVLAMLTLFFLTQALLREGYQATVLLLAAVQVNQFFENNTFYFQNECGVSALF